MQNGCFCSAVWVLLQCNYGHIAMPKHPNGRAKAPILVGDPAIICLPNRLPMWLHHHFGAPDCNFQKC